MKKSLAAVSTFVYLIISVISHAQNCVTAGQTPSTVFPVCGTTTFHQAQVPLCSTNSLFVPGCSGTGGNYENRNPFFYKFTCYVSGTLGFIVTPLAANEDYDWQLYNITGVNPNDIFTNNSLVVSGNWSGTYGPTGAQPGGANFIQCASVPSDNLPSFAAMPTLIAGNEYLLMISHFTNTQSGYDLSFTGGTAVITDPAIPHMQSAKPDCDGRTITVKLNKKIRCSSLTASGSEFTLSPAATTVTSAATVNCTSGFDFDELRITLASPLPNGNYQLVINNGTDGNTLLDICGNAIIQGENVPFVYNIPQPIFADSVGRLSCATDSIRIYFPKKIACNSIAPNGSDFSVSGPSPVNVVSAFGNCVNGKTDYVVVKFSNPIVVGGNYQVTLKAGTDGSVIIDECGQETPVHSLPFVASDTVNADFNMLTRLGCRTDTVAFSHNGAHQVNSWTWRINNGNPITTQSHTAVFPATSNNIVSLKVSNGVCMDSTSTTIVFNNEVKADFSMPQYLCPEDGLEVINNSSGLIDSYFWQFDQFGTSTLEDPLPFNFPINNRESYYTIKLQVRNNALNCTDSARRTLTVLNHCYIGVPTAFTPNNDGLNDFFHPHNALKADNYEFRVFNRWGQLVFYSRDWRQKWDGKIKGVLQAPDVYVWYLRYTHRDTGKSVFEKGTVMLIR